MKPFSLITLFMVGSLLAPATLFAQNAPAAKTATLKAPVIITTLGQSPGALMLKMIAKKANIECEQINTLKPEQLKEKPYKTLMITMGTSLKGMGAAGTDIQKEVERIKAVVAEAKKLGMTVVGAHIEGMARRTDESDKISVETVTNLSEVLIVKEESDQDGYFTKYAQSKNIPIHSVKQPMDLTKTFSEIFK